MIIGSRIKYLREANDMKQKELAAILQLSPSTINKYEKGERIPEIKHLIKIADFFDVSTDFLLGRKEY
ncbi:MAG: helix-turn-helix transcriptional regulator [Clostridia bacterium]|nr:helix-turn-helix transcriptional regulator [Clostridiales bacterium]MBR2029765.1 helix-turn-helix transcriptional regulator [Clostridia bacterium]MBR2303033.1 helix-turn-helix transcriptional regulator [Clostridia bacterium]